MIKTVTRTGFDMDPFVIVSLGKKTFRTKHIRHSLNPVYDEKMLFQVLRHEQNYSLSFTIVDRDKFSSNDFVAQASFPVSEIQRTQPAVLLILLNGLSFLGKDRMRLKAGKRNEEKRNCRFKYLKMVCC